MAQASRKRLLSEPLGNQLSRNIKEVSMIAMIAVAVYLMIALYSYQPDDPGWSHASSVDAIRNRAGVVIDRDVADIRIEVNLHIGSGLD